MSQVVEFVAGAAGALVLAGLIIAALTGIAHR